MSELRETYDVVMLGGGLASLCLARLLSLELPEANVLTLDHGAGPSRKVGESTVEIGAHFLHSRLQLSDALARTQLPKNGLRYWFDDEAHQLPFGQASEDGPATFAYWRSYQLERETLERTLLESAGGTHLYDLSGVEVLPRDGDAHGVGFDRDGVRCEVKARWLIDARGVGAFSNPPSGNLEAEPRVTHSAAWAWFEGAQRVDDLVPPRASRPCVGPRLLSTNHFLYEGYWIWAIPLASGLLSVGLVYDHTVLLEPPTDSDELVAFLRSHRMVEQLLEGAQPVASGRLLDYARRPRQVVTTDRTAWLGLAAGFVDPFYSNGIDMIALECEAVADLVRRDLGGEPPQPQRVEAYNGCVHGFYEQVVMFIGGVYPTFASHELSVIRYRRDIHLYWTLFTWAYLSGKLFELEFLARFKPLIDESVVRGLFFARLLRHCHEQLKQRGELHRSNRGRYTFNQLGFRNFPYVRCEQHMADPPDLEACWRAALEIDTGSFLALVDCVFDGDRSPLRGLLFDALHPHYDAVMALEQSEGGLGAGFWKGAFELLSRGIREVLTAHGIACPELSLTPEAHGQLLPNVLAACDPEDETRIRALYFEVPKLEVFPAPRVAREQAQADAEWPLTHTPWLEDSPPFCTVYQLLGDEWVGGGGGSLAAVAPRLAALTGKKPD